MSTDLLNEFTDDVIKAYQDALQAFYDVGVRYLQLDDVYIARLSSPDITFQMILREMMQSIER